MKLSETHTASLIESRFLKFINEAGEGPRWKFQYDGYKHDPTPDILLLGSYIHPSTGNNLVGGINLNYLDINKRNALAKALPQIINSGNLYSRYHTGRRLLPSIFNNFYRTYNANKIRGVSTDVMYPQYGFKKAAQNAVKKAVNQTQPQQPASQEPKFNSDLSSMNDRLDQVVAKLSDPKSQERTTHPNAPEVQIARQEFQKPQPQQPKEIKQFQSADGQLQATQYNTGKAQLQAIDNSTVVYPQQPQAAPKVDPQQPQVQQNNQQPQNDPNQMRQAIAKEIEQNNEELQEIANNQTESIRYYSKKQGKYITESLNLESILSNYAKQTRHTTSTRKI